MVVAKLAITAADRKPVVGKEGVIIVTSVAHNKSTAPLCTHKGILGWDVWPCFAADIFFVEVHCEPQPFAAHRVLCRRIA